MSIKKWAQDMGVSDLVRKLEKLEEENKKLKDEITALERFILNLQEHIDNQDRGYEPQFENGMPKYKSDLFK